jgi:hypothetical protein
MAREEQQAPAELQAPAAAPAAVAAAVDADCWLPAVLQHAATPAALTPPTREPCCQQTETPEQHPQKQQRPQLAVVHFQHRTTCALRSTHPAALLLLLLAVLAVQ